MSIRIIISIKAAPGRGDELAAGIRARCKEVQQEPGCLQYEIFRSLSDPDDLALLELWQDQAALDAHEALNAARPPMPTELRAAVPGREDYAYNRIR